MQVQFFKHSFSQSFNVILLFTPTFDVSGNLTLLRYYTLTCFLLSHNLLNRLSETNLAVTLMYTCTRPRHTQSLTALHTHSLNSDTSTHTHTHTNQSLTALHTHSLNSDTSTLTHTNQSLPYNYHLKTKFFTKQIDLKISQSKGNKSSQQSIIYRKNLVK